MERQDAGSARSARSERGLSPDVDSLASEVIAAAIEVHRTLGAGCAEGFYERAMGHELALRRIPFERRAAVAVAFKGVPIGAMRLDLVVDERLVVELESVEALAPVQLAQALSYLRATGLQLALVINFNVPVLLRGVRRVIRTER